jgi:aminopeptidase N
MIHTLLGAERFRQGMDLYFARHDGQAVTTDDFVAAMADAGGADLGQFRRWYEQAGTPVVEAQGAYDAAARAYTLTLRQSCPPTPGQPEKLPFHIPFEVGLVDPAGQDMPLRLAGEAAAAGTTRVLSLKAAEERYTFVDVAQSPVPSLLRDFSAPVYLKFEYRDAELAHLMAHDSDAFNRWEAGQRLATRLMLDCIAAGRLDVPAIFLDAFARALREGGRDPAFAAEVLALPAETFIAEQMALVDPDAIHATRRGLRRALAQALRADLLATYERLAVPGPYAPDAASAGRRSLRNLCLAYLMELADAEARALAARQLEAADNMTDALAALGTLANTDCPEREPALAAFYAKWKHEALVVDKWLRVQSTAHLPDALARVTALLGHEAFTLKNPNKVYALVGGFGYGNHVRFHAADGSGYAFMADRIVELDALNPQVAARMSRSFDRWKKFDAGRQAQARAALERIRDVQGLSKDVAEIVTKALA